MSLSSAHNFKHSLIGEIAKYLKSNIKDEKKHIKVQKMLYYAQGFNLALNQGKPLFDNKIEAWILGPVVTDVYYNWSIVDECGELNDEKAKTVLDLVLNTFKSWDASDLVTQTHIEDPWLEAIKEQRSEITKESMHRFFNTKIKND